MGRLATLGLAALLACGPIRQDWITPTIKPASGSVTAPTVHTSDMKTCGNNAACANTDSVTPLAGDVIVCAYTHGSGVSPQAPTDSKSQTYTQIGTTQTGAGASNSIWESANVAAGATTVTGHLSGAPGFTWTDSCFDLSGTPAAGGYNGDYLGTTQAAPGSCTTDGITTGTTSVSPVINSLALAFASNSGNSSELNTQGTGWTVGPIQTNNSSLTAFYSESKAVAAKYAATWTCANTSIGTTVMVTASFAGH